MNPAGTVPPQPTRAAGEWAVPPSSLLSVSSAAVTLGVAFGFIRVFEGAGFLVTLGVVTVAGHVLAAVTRRLPPGIPTLTMLVVGALVCIDLTHWSAVTLGIPTPFTFDVVSVSLQQAVDTLRTAAAPVDAGPGLLFVASVALWAVAWSSDRLHFVYGASVEALVPAGTVFVVVTALSGPDHRWLSAAVFGGTVALHLLLRRHVVGSGTDGPAGSWRPLVRGGAMAAGALVVGLGTAATVPALSTEGVAGLRSKDTITVVSPLVDIRSRLVDQSDTELFHVTASRPAYWRLMALDSFDGEQWAPPDSEVTDTSARFLTDGPGEETPTPPAERMRADFELGGLGGSYAPAPFRPVYVSDQVAVDDRGASPRLLWDSGYATLLASSATGDVTHLSYTVFSDVPTVDARLVRSAAAPAPRPITEHFTRLPADFPDDLTAEAERIVAGARTPYEQAMALQDFFTKNDFVYSTELPPLVDGEDTSAIRAFLEHRTGFCEQFAGTYAALARAVGLPTRIAVGFTWGEEVARNADGSGATYRVTGRNAHAWPEVYFAGLGWLPFEPTPGRGNPHAEAYTGIDAAQDESGPTPPGMTTAPPTSAPGQVPAIPTSVPGPTPTSVPAGPGAGTSGSGAATSSGPSLRSVLVGLGVAAVLAAGPTLRWARRRMRRRNADSPARRVRLAWAETLGAWRPLELRRTEVDTHRDLGDRLADRLANLTDAGRSGDDTAPSRARRLAELAAAAAWNSAGVSERDAAEAQAAADHLGRIARDHRSWWSRLVGWFDPRLATFD